MMAHHGRQAGVTEPIRHLLHLLFNRVDKQMVTGVTAGQIGALSPLLGLQGISRPKDSNDGRVSEQSLHANAIRAARYCVSVKIAVAPAG
ncbi:hypothetical protein D8S82_22135 [Mycobacterium hodleri]|uniref:Uncharacterized protein n=1 Tax=Mycolicibacterium hodleri TaxID=49897 RepID=A0A544VWP1_9MYCO|nr:hypothetical protein [Mycolicibacterium hodleri]TQR84409.1 hypothetical protein D8S82_22135 [Mycolicibacterium hodleri]